MNGKGCFRKIAALTTAAVMAVTGVSAASGMGLSSADAASSVRSENRYESFLGLDDSFAMLWDYYLYPYGLDDNVNVWSGNLMVRYTLPYGNAYSNFLMSLTYNSQADCDIGFGRNVAMTYWVSLTQPDPDTVKIMGGTGMVRTFVKNQATGKYENAEGSVERLADGSYVAVWSKSHYAFSPEGKPVSMQTGGNSIQVYYNDLGFVDTLEGNEQNYYFEYGVCPDGEVRCSKIINNGQLLLEYDQQGRLSCGYDMGDPEQKAFSYTYGENGLMTAFETPDVPSVSVQYQTSDGCQKVSNIGGTQIVYGKNQTLAIDPDGIVTTWRFDDNGNLM